MAKILSLVTEKVRSLAEDLLAGAYVPDEEERRTDIIDESEFNAIDDDGNPCLVRLVAVLWYPHEENNGNGGESEEDESPPEE